MYYRSNTHSTKRHATSNLRIDIEMQKLFHHVPTQWISISSYIYRKKKKIISFMLIVTHHKKERYRSIMTALLNFSSFWKEAKLQNQ
jgi:hypothetical protein